MRNTVINTAIMAENQLYQPCHNDQWLIHNQVYQTYFTAVFLGCREWMFHRIITPHSCADTLPAEMHRLYIKDGCGFQVWKMKPTWKCLKCAFFLKVNREWLLRLQKEVTLCRSLKSQVLSYKLMLLCFFQFYERSKCDIVSKILTLTALLILL